MKSIHLINLSLKKTSKGHLLTFYISFGLDLETGPFVVAQCFKNN